jgi:hypothetical protein
VPAGLPDDFFSNQIWVNFVEPLIGKCHLAYFTDIWDIL